MARKSAHKEHDIAQEILSEHIKGIKHDKGKPDYSLIPPFALDEIAKVLTHGKDKYARDNWKHLDDGPNRYFAAAQRHLWALRKGEDIDPESGYHHAIHAICCMMFYYEITNK